MIRRLPRCATPDFHIQQESKYERRIAGAVCHFRL